MSPPLPSARLIPRIPWVIAALACLATMPLMRAEGRLWWCACGKANLWAPDVWSSHCSQHLVDPYSLTHLSHGLIIWILFVWWARWFPRFDPSFAWRFAAAAVFAAGWEVLENSPIVIDRYRSETMSLDYMGDSIVNSMGDIACCLGGLLLARRLGVARTILLFIASELLLLWLIRDNLTLNVVMLLWPVPAIKAWQTVGH